MRFRTLCLVFATLGAIAMAQVQACPLSDARDAGQVVELPNGFVAITPYKVGEFDQSTFDALQGAFR